MSCFFLPVPDQLGRHRTSSSMNSSTLARALSGARLLSSHNDLADLDAPAETSEQTASAQPSPPLSARGTSTDAMSAISRQSSRLLLSPGARDSLSFDQIGGDPMTPRSNPTHSPSPFSPVPEEQTSPAPNKAFKLVPLRKQMSDGLTTDTASPSTKLRSNSTSEALNAAGLSSLQRPVTGRVQGTNYNDFDDDDSYQQSNWRNITLDPSPSVPVLTPSAGSRKGASAKMTSAVRRESMSQSRASSSSSLTVTPTSAPSSSATSKERTPPPSAMSRVAASALSSAAAAVASIAVTGNRPRDGPSVASNSGIAAIQSNLR
jgi:hypothetical protein